MDHFIGSVNPEFQSKHTAVTQVGMLQKSYGKADFHLDNPIPAGKVPSADVSVIKSVEEILLWRVFNYKFLKNDV